MRTLLVMLLWWPITVLSSEPTKFIAKPTDYLAEERTYLAWVRTSLAVMTVGFGLAKFRRRASVDCCVLCRARHFGTDCLDCDMGLLFARSQPS